MSRLKIIYSALAVIENRLIGFDSVSNGFFDISISNDGWEFNNFYFFEDEDTCFGKPYVIKNETWFPPCKSKNAIRISEEGSSQYLINSGIGIPHRFTNMLIHKGNAVFIPGCENGIVLYDLNSAKEKIIDNWVKEYEQIAFQGNAPEIYGKSRYGQYVLIGEKILIPLLHASTVLEVGLDTGRSTIHRISGGDDTGFLAIYGNENRKFLLTRSTNEILEVEKNVVVHRFELDMNETTPGRSLECDGKIYVLGHKKAVLRIFDMRNKKTVGIDLSAILENTEDIDFGAFIQNEKLLYIFENRKGCLISVDVAGNQAVLKEILIQLDEVSKLKLMAKKAKAGHIIKESTLFTLGDFLKINS